MTLRDHCNLRAPVTPAPALRTSLCLVPSPSLLTGAAPEATPQSPPAHRPPSQSLGTLICNAAPPPSRGVGGAGWPACLRGSCKGRCRNTWPPLDSGATWGSSAAKKHPRLETPPAQPLNQQLAGAPGRPGLKARLCHLLSRGGTAGPRFLRLHSGDTSTCRGGTWQPRQRRWVHFRAPALGTLPAAWAPSRPPSCSALTSEAMNILGDSVRARARGRQHCVAPQH